VVMKRAISRLVIFLVIPFIIISFTAKASPAFQKPAIADETCKGLELKRPVSLPRMIVLPLQSENHDFHNETGLALHFYLSNILALHTGLDEFWFSWRMKSLFPHKDDLFAYIRGSTPLSNPGLQAEKQGIRYLLQGKVMKTGKAVKVFFDLTDIQRSAHTMKTAIEIKDPGRLDLFALDFIRWLKACGLSMSRDQAEKAIWKEEISFTGLSSLGKALEDYYAHSYCPPDDMLQMESFNSAVNLAPGSYMAADLLGWAFYKNRRYSEAQSQFISSLKINPAGAGALSGLIWCAVMAGHEDEGYRLGRIRARLRNEPEGYRLAIIANRFGNIASKAGERDRSIRMYEKAAGCNPWKSIYLTKLASEYSKINKYEKALRVLDTPPPLPWPKMEKERLQIKRAQILVRYAMFLKKSEKYKEALSRLEQALEIETNKKASDIIRHMEDIRAEMQDKKRGRGRPNDNL